MRAIVTVIGQDRVGIIAAVATALAARQANILDLSQTVMQGYFTMIMLVDLSAITVALDELSAEMGGIGAAMGLQIKVQREDIFESMHHL